MQQTLKQLLSNAGVFATKLTLAIVVVFCLAGKLVAAPAAPPEQVERDWLLQDAPATKGKFTSSALEAPLKELGSAGAEIRKQTDALIAQKAPATDERYRQLYLQACRLRRTARLAKHFEVMRKLVFIQRTNIIGGSHYAYTEAQSDHQGEFNYYPDTALCVLELSDASGAGTIRTLVADRTGQLRDPDVSYDGKRVLFSWKKSADKDDFHLYEIPAASSAAGDARQITSGLGLADIEPSYLPNGDIVFNSTRCVQTVDCASPEVSNLYTCDPRGRFLRRLGYDQVHTTYTTVTPEGTVLYTRWDYNDRGQMFPQALFQMNYDGTGQSAFYGNNSWFPTSVLHARAIPGTKKVVCIFSGHHTRQKGWLGILDPTLGREENQGAQLIAPVRPTAAWREDTYGQAGDQFQYPYPLSETEFLVTMQPWMDPPLQDPWRSERMSSFGRYGLYWVASDGRRELLAYDAKYNCSQCVPVRARPVPKVPPTTVDYRKTTGTFLMQDIYQGPGLKGIPRGTIKSLRVVALEFRAATIDSSYNSGPAGGASVFTPISMQGAWDVKVILGSTKVHPDGSAAFVVPAHTPVYFQALDERGYVVQTMRSWATLMPGEKATCVGCHESKNAAPPRLASMPQAYSQVQEKLTAWHDRPIRGFSFAKEIQPILDEKCIRCHYLPQPHPKDPLGYDRAYDMEGEGNPTWKYAQDIDAAAWYKPGFDDSAWPSGSGTFARPVNNWNYNGLWKGKKLYLRRTFKLANRIPANSVALKVEGGEGDVYINGVFALHCTSRLLGPYYMAPISPEARTTLKRGTNLIAVVAEPSTYPPGDRIQVRMQDICYRPYADVKQDPTAKPAFSLRGDLRDWKWTDGYIAMRNPIYTNWLSPQSEPSMLEPYHAGACKSPVLKMLASGHQGVRLSAEELDRIATWIDLLVPCYGDYADSLRGDARKRYEQFLQKRRSCEEQERRNIQDLLENRK